MIKTRYISLIILIAFVFINISYASQENQRYNVFSGRIIYIANDYLELKKGNTEITVYFADDTKYISLKGAPVDKNRIKLCQYVNANYSLQGTKKILNKIIITKESICYK